MIQDIDNPASVKRQLAQLFEVSLRATVPDETDVVPLVEACTSKTGGVKFGDYQWLVLFFLLIITIMLICGISVVNCIVHWPLCMSVK